MNDLRDRFAMAALPAVANLVAHVSVKMADSGLSEPKLFDTKLWAEQAYSIADAMMSHRDKAKGNV